MSGASSLDMQALADRAIRVRDRVSLSSVIGRDVKLSKAGREQTGLCPFHDDRKAGSFMVNDDKQLFKCFACGKSGDVISYVQDRKGKSFMEALRLLEADAGIDFSDAKAKVEADQVRRKREREQLQDAARRRRNARELWIYGCVPGIDTPAQRYLEGRGIDFAQLGRFPGAIRFRHRLLNGETGQELPAMVTAIHDEVGDLCAVHRTWLRFDGRGWQKAALDKPKMVLGDFYAGSIPLWKGATRSSLSKAPAGAPVALSEGIEDGLSVAMATPDLRVHAAISIDNMGNVALPPSAGELILLCQRDGDVRAARAAQARAGGDEEGAARHERAAAQIAAALERAIGKLQVAAKADGSNRLVRTAWPSPGFKDFNDELRGQRMGGEA